MKEFGKILPRTGKFPLRAEPRAKVQHVPRTFRLKEGEEPEGIHDVNSVPDSWKNVDGSRPRKKEVPSAPASSAAPTPADALTAEAAPSILSGTEQRRHLKRRRSSLSLSVSIEEEQILKKAAFEKELSFSDWARAILFKNIGIKVPSRPQRY